MTYCDFSRFSSESFLRWDPIWRFCKSHRRIPLKYKCSAVKLFSTCKLGFGINTQKNILLS